MVTTLAIISGSTIAVILIGYFLYVFYKHARAITIKRLLTEVLITVLTVSVIVFIVAMWVLFTDLANAIAVSLACVALVIILALAIAGYAE